jgi:hypothetical protein
MSYATWLLAKVVAHAQCLSAAVMCTPAALAHSQQFACSGAASIRSGAVLLSDMHAQLLLLLVLLLPQGFDIAKKALLEFLDNFKTPVDPSDREVRPSSSSSQCRNRCQHRCAAPAHGCSSVPCSDILH